MANGWGVYDLSGNLVFDVDTVLDLKFSAKAKVSDFPVENNAFTSFNKVVEPFTPKVRLAVGGMIRVSAFQEALAVELASTNLYNIVTPTCNYFNVTLDGCDYAQTADNGNASLLVVDLSLKQIREVTPAYTTVKIPHPKSPASASKEPGGKGQAQPPAAPPSHTWATVMAEADTAAGGK